MPFTVRAADAEPTDDPRRTYLIPPGRLTDDRMSIEIASLDAADAIDIATEDTELAWIQILGGECSLDDDLLSPDWLVMLARGASAHLTAVTPTRLFIARVPRAAEDDPTLAPETRVLHDWTTEPVLNSEHDSRTRIYLASPGLWGTHAVKGELITYPPGCAGAAHHHEGAEHFQYVLAGSGTAVLEGTEIDLHEGDLLYNYENELHWFRNDTEADMVFAEFFVPGVSATVWAPGALACGWEPTGHDIKGREPARQLSYHIHGQGDV